MQGNEKFKQMVNDWQTKLGTVESVLTCWGDVQKKWQALESIFIGSADIRVQLPEDSKRFDAINADFQDLMRSAPDVTGMLFKPSEWHVFVSTHICIYTNMRI